MEDLISNGANLNRAEALDAMKKTLTYMINITELRMDQIFKICIEFWGTFTTHLRKDSTS